MGKNKFIFTYLVINQKFSFTNKNSSFGKTQVIYLLAEIGLVGSIYRKVVICGRGHY